MHSPCARLSCIAQGASHPVFGGLRRSTRHARVRVLGFCGPSTPSAGAATPAALRAELEAAQHEEQPTVVVLCPPPPPASTEGGSPADPEAELLSAAAALLKELAPERHLLVHAVHAASTAQRVQRETRRRLLAAEAVRGDAANRTSNYTVCDPTCQKHVRCGAAGC
jgi:sugar phosphate isomerase/epimerase